jgi:cadmium resistance protein CadD (predicted permease)
MLFMPFPARALILGITLFAATNIDDTFVLLGFFADPKFRPHQVVIGQYLGIATLVAVSLLAALIALVIPPAYVGLLGLAPIAIGTRKLVDLWGGRDKGEAELERHPASGAAHGQAFAVAAVTIANGGDNIGVYTPVFAVRSGIETAVIIGVFVLMTGVWCAIAHWLVHHRTIGAPIRKYGHLILPPLLIGLGLSVLLESGSFALL